MNATSATVGFIGLGTLGAPMVRRLLERGLDVVVWNRTATRCDAAVAAGARLAASPAELATRCDVVGLCLADATAVQDVALGDAGLLRADGRRVTHVIDFSTGDPAIAVELARRARPLGIAWIDCPVSGGPPAAAAGTLIGFAGACDAALDAVRSVTDALFVRITPMGGAGAGQLAKLCNQVIVASNLLVMAEALAAAQAWGIDATRMPQALAGGFADSMPLQLFGPRMASRTFDPPLGSIRLMRKDVHLALAAATDRGVAMPMLTQAAALYDRVGTTADMSLDDDISSVIRLFDPFPALSS